MTECFLGVENSFCYSQNYIVRESLLFYFICIEAMLGVLSFMKVVCCVKSAELEVK